jgi:hypothetical protein
MLSTTENFSAWSSKTTQRKCEPNPTLSFKAMKLIRLLQYGSVATLLLAAGDISPNPGWIYPSINGAGRKVGHLNIRSLPMHLDELKILLQDNPFDILCL